MGRAELPDSFQDDGGLSHQLDEQEIRVFLTRPFRRIEFAEMARMPSRNLLRWMPHLPDVTAISKVQDYWTLIKANDTGVPAWAVPMGYDLFIHSHPHEEGEALPIQSAIPDLEDFKTTSGSGRTMITSEVGLTVYSRPYNFARIRSRIEAAIDSNEFDDSKYEQYLRFLEENGFDYHIYPWEELGDSRLRQLLGEYSD